MSEQQISVGQILSSAARRLFGRVTAGAGAGEEIVLDTDGTLAADSDDVVATQKAVKQYVDDNAGGGSAAEITTDTTDFDGVLSAADSEVQAALETIDEHHPGGFVREVLGAARTYYVRHNVGDCTISNASPAVVTKAAHGLLDDDPVVFKTDGSLPTGLTPGVVYYVNYVDADTFQVAATPDGASINTSSAGSGTHSVATGSDSNDGKSTGRAGALLTIQKAINLAAALDTSIYNVTIQLAKSRYVESPAPKAASGAGTITILGDASTPSNVVIDGGFSYSGPGTSYTLQGFTLIKATTSTAVALQVQAGARLTFLNLDFSTGFTFHIYLPYTGTVFINGSYTISGGATRHIDCELGSVVRQQGSGTGTVSGTPAFSQFIIAVAGGLVKIISSAFSYSGAATGTRYSASTNAVIDTAGGGANFFPGDAAGSTATGGQYA